MQPPKDNRTATQEFAMRDVLISHCGETLTPDKVSKIATELLTAIQSGPCAWAWAKPIGENTPNAAIPNDPRDAGCHKSPSGFHDYRTIRDDWDSETRKCTHCGESYKIYESEML